MINTMVMDMRKIQNRPANPRPELEVPSCVSVVKIHPEKIGYPTQRLHTFQTIPLSHLLSHTMKITKPSPAQHVKFYVLLPLGIKPKVCTYEVPATDNRPGSQPMQWYTAQSTSSHANRRRHPITFIGNYETSNHISLSWFLLYLQSHSPSTEAA